MQATGKRPKHLKLTSLACIPLGCSSSPAASLSLFRTMASSTPIYSNCEHHIDPRVARDALTLRSVFILQAVSAMVSVFWYRHLFQE